MSVQKMTEEEVKQAKMEHPDFLGFDIPDGEEVRQLTKPNRAGLEHHLHPLPRHIEDQMPRPPTDQFPPIPAPIEASSPEQSTVGADDSILDIDELGLDDEVDSDKSDPRQGSKRSADGQEEPRASKRLRTTFSSEDEYEGQDDESNSVATDSPYIPDIPVGCRLLQQFRHTLTTASEDSESSESEASLEEGTYLVDWVGASRWNPAKSTGSKLEYHVKWRGYEEMTWEPRANLPDDLIEELEQSHGQVEKRYREYEHEPELQEAPQRTSNGKTRRGKPKSKHFSRPRRNAKSS